MDTAALTAIVDDVADANGPGLAVGVYRGGTLHAHASAGLASVEFRSPVDEHTRFDIASMSKQFTATAILLLARDGLLRLDDDIRAHLPELRLPEPVTIAQCLQHTGGLPEWYSLVAVAGEPLSRLSQDRLLSFIAEFTTLTSAPGTEFAYSNTGYALAASLAKRVTGRSLGEFAAERIFTPLGMRSTLFREDTRAVIPGFASGYAGEDDQLQRADTEEDAVGDGGLATSVHELAAWFRFLRDGDVLGADIRDALLDGRPRFPDGTEGPYAYGIWHSSIDDVAVVGHAGGVEGYASQLLYAPELDLGVVVLANCSSIRAGLVATRVLRLAAGTSDAGRPVSGDVVDADGEERIPAGWWIARGSDHHVQTLSGPDGAVLLRGVISGTFRHAGDGLWRGEGDDEDVRLRTDGRQLSIGAALRPGRDLVFERCAAPDPQAAVRAGTYVGVDLDTGVTIRQDGGFSIGPALHGTLAAGPDGTFLAGWAILRVDGDDLLMSVDGAPKLRFVRRDQEADAAVVPDARLR